MTPTHYDTLGVSPEATDAELRAAWTAKMGGLDPARDQQRLSEVTSAAGVLLDRDRRRAYDEELAEQRRLEEQSAAEDDAATEPGPAPRSSRTVRAATVALAVLALLAVVAAVVVHGRAGSDEALEDTWTSAPATAEKAATAILSYDYRSLDGDVRAARQWLAPSYRGEYDKQVSSLRKAAVAKKVAVEAQVYATGVISASATQASVLVYVDQTRTVNGTTDNPVANRVRLDMVLRDGSWLVDDIHSYD